MRGKYTSMVKGGGDRIKIGLTSLGNDVLTDSRPSKTSQLGQRPGPASTMKDAQMLHANVDIKTIMS